ncbi:hypothetical protein Misp02_13240 [Microtetraspora sp. NBRC 16547]|nr:hypothetical protein Misp02_13240 [Microtetraspora sp. NBRC 16547]
MRQSGLRDLGPAPAVIDLSSHARLLEWWPPAVLAGEITLADRTDNLSRPTCHGGRTRSFPSPRPAHAVDRTALVSADDEGTASNGMNASRESRTHCLEHKFDQVHCQAP